MWSTKALHCFPEEFQCSFAITTLGDIAFKHLAFVIHCPPEIVGFTVDFYEHLVQMPLPIRMSAKVLNPFSSNLRRKHRPKSVPPEANSFVANIDTALVQQVFHISKRKWITHIHHNRQADDLRARLEVLEWVAFYHPATLICRSARLNQFSSDSAPGSAAEQ